MFDYKWLYYMKAIHVEDEQRLASLKTHHLPNHVGYNQIIDGLVLQPVTDNMHKIYEYQFLPHFISNTNTNPNILEYECRTDTSVWIHIRIYLLDI